MDKMVLGQFCLPVGRFSLPVSFHHYSILIFHASTTDIRGMRWRSWLRHCATSRKVVGSIPENVIGIFHSHNPPGRTMALRLTQPVTEMSTRNISWGSKGSRCTGLTTLPPSCAVLKSGSLNLLEPSGSLQACNGIAFLISAITGFDQN